MSSVRHICVPGIFNMRDLGGYPTMDDYVTRWNKLYRSDAPIDLDEKGWEKLKSMGICCIIDLRTTVEANGEPVNPPSSIKYIRISLMKDIQGERLSEEMLKESMEVDYEKILFSNLDSCVSVLRTISEQLDRGAVLFFCAAGKDRTGIIASILLALAEVCREDIMADYIQSEIYNEDGINRKAEKLFHLEKGTPLYEALMGSRPYMLAPLLEKLVNGSFFEILEDHGFSREERFALKDKLIFSEK